MKTKDIISSILIAWGTISILIITVLVIPFFINIDFISQEIPICPSKLNNESCLLCGMTRAFVEISNGNFSVAHTLNSLSIPLYSLCIINSSIFVFILIQKLYKLWQE